MAIPSHYRDASGNPTRNAPAYGKKPLAVEFDPEEFAREIQQHGDALRWEQAARCACSGNAQTGQAHPLCPECYGQGWEYHTPLEIQGIVDRLENRRDSLNALGDWVFGSAVVTVEPMHRLNYRDRLVMLQSVVTYSEVIHRGPEGEADRLAFPVATLSERVQQLALNDAGEQVLRNVVATYGVLRLRVVGEGGLPGPVLRHGYDFEVDDDGRIDWRLGDQTGTAPTPGTRGGRAQLHGERGGAYAVTYYHHPSYLVSNWPFAARVLHLAAKRPTVEHIPGPTQAFAQMEARVDRAPAGVPGG